jgi:hypothetical protein
MAPENSIRYESSAECKSLLDGVRKLYNSRNYVALGRIMGQADPATSAFRKSVQRCGFDVTLSDMHVGREKTLEILSSPETRRILAGTCAHGLYF